MFHVRSVRDATRLRALERVDNGISVALRGEQDAEVHCPVGAAQLVGPAIGGCGLNEVAAGLVNEPHVRRCFGMSSLLSTLVCLSGGVKIPATLEQDPETYRPSGLPS